MTDGAGDSEQLLRSASLVFLASFAGNALGIGVRILLTQSYPVAEFGRIMTGYTAFILLGTVGVWGMNSGLAYYLPRRSEFDWTAKELVVSAVLFGMGISLIIGVVGYRFREQLAVQMFNDPALAAHLGLFLLAIPLYAVFHVIIGAFRGYENTGLKVLWKDISFNFAQLVAVSTFVALGIGAELVGGAYIISTGAVLFLTVAFVRPDVAAWGRSSLAAVRNIADNWWLLLTYSTPLIFAAIATWGTDYIDTFLLQILEGPTTVAYYKAVYPIAIALNLINGSFGFLYLPLVSKSSGRDGRSHVKQLYALSTGVSFAATVPIAVAVLAFPSLIIGLVYPQSYTVAAFALQLLALAFFTEVVLGLNRASLNALGRTRANLTITVLSLAANVLLNTYLIPEFGLEGAAVATLLSFLFWNIGTSAWLYYTERLHPFASFYLKSGAVSLALSGVSVGGLKLLLTGYQLSTLPTVALLAVVGGAVVFTNLRVLVAIAPERVVGDVAMFDAVREPVAYARRLL